LVEWKGSMEGMEVKGQLDLQKTFKKKRILLTGHTGFKGGWLSFWLNELGSDVTGFSNGVPTNPSFFETVGLKDCLTDVEGGVRDLKHLKRIVRKCDPEYIFHLAAQPLVRDSYANPIETFETNVLGTANLLEAARECESLVSCVCITSDKCYENQDWAFAYRENDRLGGKDPYSASKAAAEIVAASYWTSFYQSRDGKRPAIVTARAGNVIGGGDWAKDRIIPDCIRALKDGRSIVIRNPDSIRPWQHVLEPLAGYLRLAALSGHDPDRYSGAWNFGPVGEGTISVRSLVDKVIDEWGSGKSELGAQDKKRPEASILKLDCTKAMDALNWRPSLKVTEAIEMTVSWYKEMLSGDRDMKKFTSGQIKKYSESITRISDATAMVRR
jgi:CDP-glucose 4,6-dehydratase